MMALLEESRSYGSDGSNIHDVLTTDGGKQWGITRCMTPHPTLLSTWKDYLATASYLPYYSMGTLCDCC